MEEWKDLPGFSRYEVSNLGSVRARPFTTLHGHRRNSRIVTQRADSYGYLVVQLLKDGNSHPRPYRVHRLVGEAFLGPLPAGRETLHGPGGRQDNRLVNLSYGSRSQNEQDKKRDGTFRHNDGSRTSGEANPNARLTRAAVSEIRRQYATGRRQVDLARDFGITQATVSLITRRQTWAHLP